MSLNTAFITVISFLGINWGVAASFDSLTEYMQQEIAFEENNYNVLHLSETFAEQRTRDSEIYQNFPASIKKSKALLERIKKYQHDGLYPNALLRDVFLFRFEQIRAIALDYFAGLQRVLSGEENSDLGDAAWGITNKHVLSLSAKSSLDAQWNHIISRTSLDRFQLLSNVIKELLVHMKINGIGLTEENQRWLRCARTLHPLLSGKVSLLEWPEQAIGVNCGDEYERNYENEIGLCSHYVVPKNLVKILNKTLGADKKQGISVSMTAYELNHLPKEIFCESHRSIRDPSLPKFFFPDDVYVYEQEAPASLESAVAPPLSIEAVNEELELPKISKVKTKMGASPESMLESAVTPSLWIEAVNEELESPKTSKVKTEIDPQESIAQEEHVHESEREKSEAFVADHAQQQEEQPVSHEEWARAEHERYQNDKRAKLAELKKRVDTVGKNSMLRIKHFIEQRLQAHELTFLEHLFANKINVVSYREFKRVWERLCGKKSIVPSKKGSSHFKLLNQLGETVGGIFTHGKGQEFWGSAVADLKQNFEKIGISAEIFTGNSVTN